MALHPLTSGIALRQLLLYIFMSIHQSIHVCGVHMYVWDATTHVCMHMQCRRMYNVYTHVYIQCVCVYKYRYIYEYVCMYVYVYIQTLWVWNETMIFSAGAQIFKSIMHKCVCVRVCLCLCVFVRVRACVCSCVCEREREGERERKVPPKNGLIALWSATNGRVSTF